MTECESYRNCLEIEGNVKMPLDLASGDLHLPRQALVGMEHEDPMGVVGTWGSWRCFPDSVTLGFCVHGGSMRSCGLVCDLLVEEEEEEGWGSP